MVKTINKAELVAAVAEAGDTTKAEAEKVINAMLAVITRELVACNEIMLPQIGKLTTVDRPARQIRNPQTGETMDKLADRAVKFKPAKGLKDAVNA